MPTLWETFPIKYEGGLITNLGRIEQGIQAPGSATILQNFEPAVQGGYTRVLGYSKFSTTPVPGSGLITAVIALSIPEALALRGSTWNYSTGAGWVSKATLPVAGVVRTRHDDYNFTGVKKTVIVDGVNAPAYFNHSTKTLTYTSNGTTNTTGANVVRLFKNHLFFAKSNLVTFAAPFSDDDFTPANGAGVINVGDEVVGMVVFRDQLIIFCLNKIYRLGGSSVNDFILEPITQNTGCLCGHTIQEVGGDIMYLGPDGVRYLSASERENDFGLTRASEKVQKEILSIVNTNCMYQSVTIASKNQYRLFTYDTALDIDNSMGFVATKFSNQSADDISWATLKGFKVYSLDKIQSRDKEYILFSSSTDFIYVMEAGNSRDGANIECIFETPYMPISDPKIRKTLYKHTLYANPGGPFNLTCTVKYDYEQANSSKPPAFPIGGGNDAFVYGSPLARYGTAVYGGSNEEQYYSNTLGSGFVIALRYIESSTSSPYNLNFAVLEYRNHERR